MTSLDIRSASAPAQHTEVVQVITIQESELSARSSGSRMCISTRRHIRSTP
jgi:hypothetical protein